MRTALVLALALAACSGGSGGGTPGHPTHPQPAATDAGAPVTAAPLTVRECDDLIARAATLAGAERGSGSAAPTPAELDAVVASLRTDFGVRCAALPRAAYVCGMAAGDLAALVACQPR